MDALLAQVIDSLGARLLDWGDGGCRFAHAGFEFGLTALRGPEGPHVVGRMPLRPLLPGGEPDRVLLALYLSAELPALLGFAAWYGFDVGDGRLGLHFGTGGDFDAGQLAAMVAAVAAFGQRSAEVAA